jgi:uncharacterized membrane protein HdeD (DUF308 family)
MILKLGIFFIVIGIVKAIAAFAVRTRERKGK